MRKIILIRHGTAKIGAGERRCIGRTDLPLSEEGKREADVLGEWFYNLESEYWKQDVEIWSSPLSRAFDTARIITGHFRTSHPVRICDDLQEVNAGAWDGMKFADIRQKYPDEYRKRGEEIASYPMPGGESFYQAGFRFREAVNAIRCRTNCSLIIVTHSGVVRSYLSLLGAAEINELFSIPQPNGGMTVLEEETRETTVPCGKFALKIHKIGYKPTEFLTEDTIDGLYGKYDTEERTIRHMQAVAAFLDSLLEKFEQKEIYFDKECLHKAALLHDLVRNRKNHAIEGGRILRMEGYDEIAELVAAHHGKCLSETRLTEKELLFYADKRVLEDRIVSIRERFAASAGKCVGEEAGRKHHQLFWKTVQIETKIRGFINP